MGGDQEGTLGAGRCPLLGPREGALEERISHLSCFRTQLQLDKPPWVRGREEAGTLEGRAAMGKGAQGLRGPAGRRATARLLCP